MGRVIKRFLCEPCDIGARMDTLRRRACGFGSARLRQSASHPHDRRAPGRLSHILQRTPTRRRHTHVVLRSLLRRVIWAIIQASVKRGAPMPAEGVKKMGSLGPQEIVLILIAGLLLFGAKRLPELGKSLGQGMREFRRSLSGAADDTDKEENAKKTSDQAG